MAMNPFAVDEVQDNPFETSEEQSTHSNPWTTSPPPANNVVRAPSRTWSNDGPHRPPPPIPSAAAAGKSVRELELEKREADVRLREARLAEREKAMGGYKPPNWPKFRPMIYHNIDEEIPERGRWLVKRVYGAWYLAVIAYLMNAVAAFSCLVTKGEQGGSTFGLALVILLIGTPVSFVFWYRPLYNGVKNDSSISFMFFWFNYGFHLAVVALLAVGIPGWGGAGIILTISQLGKNAASGILCGIASGILIFECIYGLWQVKNATVYFRSQGMSVQQAKTQAAVGIAQSKVGRDIAGQAVKTAVSENINRV